jgi:hypothetical protein
VQNFAVGTTGTDFNIASAVATHTFNLPTASATNRGALSSADWTTFNNKQNALNGTGFVKISGTTISYDNSTYQLLSAKGQPNGYAGLDSNGKVPLAQINDALIGNVNFQGLWNAATNSPTLANPPASGTKGYYYIVSTAGTFAGISFEVGDWIISNGSAWGKVDNTDAVSSVFGRTGNVTAANGDYNTSQVTENTNLYYTEARVNANTNVAANTAARHNAVTLGTANGLSLNVQQLSLQLATSGQNGALSSTDWTTFNNKENAITAGTTAQYYRGDKTFQTLNTGVVPESGNLYFTNARAIASVLTGYTSGAGTISAADTILSAIQKLNGNIGALVTGVSSVNGLTGAVTLTTTNIAEGTNLYYTEARVNANANVAANTAARHAAVTLGTANGLGLTGQQLSLGLASAGVTGALSGTDWSTFNSKQQALNGTGFVKISGTTISYDNSTYLTTAAAASTYLPLAGGTMTGNINWTANDVGLTWSRNTDGASIKFISVGDGTGESYLQIGTSDNGNEAIVFTQTSLIRVQVDTDGLLKNGSSQKYVFENGGTWGIAITGNAGTVTNGVVTTGSYSNPAWITALSWTKITDRPTTLAGYGITDAVPSSRTITINGTAQDLSANRTFNVGTVTSVAALTLGTSGTDLSSSVANGTTTPVITLNVPTASAANRGALSAADWTTFNNKQNALTNPVTGTGTTNYLPKFTGASTIGNSVIFESSGSVYLGTAYVLNRTNTGGYFTGVSDNFGLTYDGTAANISNGSATPMKFYTSGALKMTLDASGNLGLGVTPSTWLSTYRNLQIGLSSSIVGQSNDTRIIFNNNAYYSGSSQWVYLANSPAAQYTMADNNHFWYTAPSGTAGNAISFTQAMTLDASGNLMVGGTSSTGYWPANLTQSAARQIIQYNDSTTNLNNANAGLVILNSNTTAGTSSKLVFGAYNTDPVAVGLAYISAVNSTRSSGYLTGDLVFGTSGGGGTGAVERFRIASTGAATFSSSVTATGNAATTPAFIANNTSGASGTAQHYIDFTAGGTVISRMSRGNGASGLVGNGLNIDNFDGFGIRLNQLGGSAGTFNVTGGASLFSNSVQATQFIPTGTSAPTIGMYQPSADALGFSTNTTDRLRIFSGGNVRIGASSVTDSGDVLRVGGTTYTDAIVTLRPSSTTVKSDVWKLGRAALATSSVPEDIWVRVQIGTKNYDLLAIDRGTA